MAKLLDEIKSRLDFGKYEIDVTMDDDRWVQFTNRRRIPDGFSICMINWELGPGNLDKVELWLETHISRKVEACSEDETYTCSEMHRKIEYIDHVAAPISVKYHIVNYIINRSELKVQGS